MISMESIRNVKLKVSLQDWKIAKTMTFSHYQLSIVTYCKGSTTSRFYLTFWEVIFIGSYTKNVENRGWTCLKIWFILFLKGVPKEGSRPSLITLSLQNAYDGCTHVVYLKIQTDSFLEALAALYLHRWRTDWLMIHHSERSKSSSPDWLRFKICCTEI